MGEARARGSLPRWNHVRRGLAFNLLTTYVDWRKDDLYYADPGRYFDFCRRELSRYVTLVHDYRWGSGRCSFTKEAS